MQRFLSLLATLLAINNAKGAVLCQISLDFDHIKQGLKGTYNYTTNTLDFNKFLNPVECKRVIHSIRKRIKRCNQKNQSPRAIRFAKIKELLGNLNSGGLNEYRRRLIIGNGKKITCHACAHCSFYHNKMYCQMFDDDDDCNCNECGCIMVLADHVRPNHKIYRFIYRLWQRESAYKSRRTEIRGIISLAENIYDLHRQSLDLYLKAYPTIDLRVDYIIQLICVINETCMDTYLKTPHPLNDVVAFYIKILDKDITTLSAIQRKHLLKPFLNDKVVNCRSILNTFQNLFTTKHMNNEAPNILATLHTRCVLACGNCVAFWKNTSLCVKPGKCPNALRDSGRCHCPNTSERLGSKLCCRWIYQPPKPETFCECSDDDYI